jgi:hypothetical protein
VGGNQVAGRIFSDSVLCPGSAINFYSEISV